MTKKEFENLIKLNINGKEYPINTYLITGICAFSGRRVYKNVRRQEHKNKLIAKKYKNKFLRWFFTNEDHVFTSYYESAHVVIYQGGSKIKIKCSCNENAQKTLKKIEEFLYDKGVSI